MATRPPLILGLHLPSRNLTGEIAPSLFIGRTGSGLQHTAGRNHRLGRIDIRMGGVAYAERFRPVRVDYYWPEPRGLGSAREVIMKISDCMTTDVQITDPEHTLQDVALMMGRLDTGVLPVGENDRLVGMITDRDIAIRGVAEGKGPKTKVRDVMSTDVKYCFEDEDVEDVLHNMGDLRVRRLPVLNRKKRLVGIISLGDLAMRGSAKETGKALGGISQRGGAHSQTAH